MLAHPTHERLIALGLTKNGQNFQEQCASPDLEPCHLKNASVSSPTVKPPRTRYQTQR